MYHYRFSKKALRDFKKIPKNKQRLIVEKLEYFASSNNPLMFAKALTNYSLGQYSFRIGDYRVIFDLAVDETISILRLGHRREVYR